MGIAASHDENTMSEPLVDPEGQGGGTVVDYGAASMAPNERDLLLPDNLAADRAQASEGPLPVPLKSMVLAELLGTFLLVQLGTAANAVTLYILSGGDLESMYLYDYSSTTSHKVSGSGRRHRHRHSSSGSGRSLSEFYLESMSNNTSSHAESISSFISSIPTTTALIWGGALAVAILTSAALSGGHVNPSVSLSFALVRPADFRLQSKLLAYWIAQVLGAALAAMMTLFLFHAAVSSFEEEHDLQRGRNENGLLSAAALNDYYSLHSPRLITNNIHAGCIEGFGAGVLCFTLFVLTHPKIPISGTIVPVLMGLVYGMLVYTLGPLTGGAFNPARELGPRLVTWLIGGWGWHVSFQGVWPYLIGPLAGGPIGAFLADHFLLLIV